MGTPGVPFSVKKETIEASIKKHGGRLIRVAAELNCKRDVIRKIISNDPELSQLLDDCRHQRDENLCDLAEDTLNDAMENRIGDMNNALKSAFFVLNNKGKDRGYNHPDAQNSGPKMTPEQVMQLINESK